MAHSLPEIEKDALRLSPEDRARLRSEAWLIIFDVLNFQKEGVFQQNLFRKSTLTPKTRI